MAKYVSISDVTLSQEANTPELIESRKAYVDAEKGYEVLDAFFADPSQALEIYGNASNNKVAALGESFGLTNEFAKKLAGYCDLYSNQHKFEQAKEKYALERAKFNKNYKADRLVPLNGRYFFRKGLLAGLKKVGLAVGHFLLDVLVSFIGLFVKLFHIIVGIGKGIGRYFKKNAQQWRECDTSGKMSYFLMGMSCIRNKQIVNGILYFITEVAFIVFLCITGVKNVIYFFTLGTIESHPAYYDEEGIFHPAVEGDNSFLSLLYGIIAIVLIVIFIYIYSRNLNAAYKNNIITNGNQYFKSFDKKRKVLSEKEQHLVNICKLDKEGKPRTKVDKKTGLTYHVYKSRGQLRKYFKSIGYDDLDSAILDTIPFKAHDLDEEGTLYLIKREEEKFHRAYDRFNDYDEVNLVSSKVLYSYAHRDEMVSVMKGPDGCKQGRKHCVARIMLHLDVSYNIALMIYKLGLQNMSISDEEMKKRADEVKAKLEKFNEENASGYHGRVVSFKAELNGMFNDHFAATVLALPTISAVVICILPLAFTILVAITNYGPGHMPPNQLFSWVGFNNFISLFSGNAIAGGGNLAETFGQLLLWTIIWAFFATFLNYVFGIILALLINLKGIKFKKMWRTIFVITIAIPQFVSLLAIARLLGDNGAINHALEAAGLSKIPFLSDPTAAKITVIVVNLWVGVPYTMLSSTGILMNIPGDLYESAKIDGAGTVRAFFKITMPYMLFVTGPSLITTFIGNINNFNVIYFLTGGGPFDGSLAQNAGKTDLLITWLYRLTTGDSEFAIASTIGIVIFAFCAFFSLVMYSRIGATKNEEEFQ